MKKIKNMKKKTIYTVLLIVVAIMVVGFAILSSTLNIFGGLGIIPGNIGWGVKWSNLEVNSESTATVNTAPTLANGDTSVNFVVTLDQPGKFYEFTVDAVNTGTMDAMIDGVSTTIYNSEDEEVYPNYLNYSVEYAEGEGEVLSGHLLRAGESVKYKVRIEFSNDITVDDLPTQEEQLRFEFGVTYIQADETAYEPGSLTKIDKMIIIANTDDFSVDNVRSLFEDNFNIIYAGGYSFVNTAAGAVDPSIQQQVKNYVEQYGAENIVIALAYAEREAAELAAETFTVGDPTFAAVLTNVQLHAPVYHIFDDALYNYYDEDVFNNDFITLYNNENENGNECVDAVRLIREQNSVHHII